MHEDMSETNEPRPRPYDGVGPPWGARLEGRLHHGEVDSAALVGNPLGDPTRRPVIVYTPPGYDATPSRRYPTVYVLLGFTGQVDMWDNRMAFRPKPVERFDALFSSGDCPPCILVFVDCWTSLGGSQYLDSPGTGRYLTYLCDEVVRWVDRSFRTLPSRDHRGVAGKSSGGYGAMVSAMLRPDVFGGLATHAGDALFEVCYAPGFATTARALRDHYDGSFVKFWQDFRSRPAFSRDTDDELVNTYAMAACYSADADGTVRLPFDLATGRILPEVWMRWLRRDPVRMVAEHREALSSLRAIYVDAGKRDEYFLDLGATAFCQELRAHGIEDVFFELFDATHAGIDYRYPLGVRYLVERLSPEA
jgi:hypothetical protein